MGRNGASDLTLRDLEVQNANLNSLYARGQATGYPNELCAPPPLPNTHLIKTWAEALNRQVSREDAPGPGRLPKGCPASPAIRETPATGSARRRAPVSAQSPPAQGSRGSAAVGEGPPGPGLPDTRKPQPRDPARTARAACGLLRRLVWPPRPCAPRSGRSDASVSSRRPRGAAARHGSFPGLTPARLCPHLRTR